MTRPVKRDVSERDAPILDQTFGREKEMDQEDGALILIRSEPKGLQFCRAAPHGRPDTARVGLTRSLNRGNRGDPGRPCRRSLTTAGNPTVRYFLARRHDRDLVRRGRHTA